MKLRNKKTGEVVEAESWTSTEGMFVIFFESKDGQLGSKECFESLAELNEEWEDYQPAEPLIKDEKIRKAVRAWLQMLGAESARVCYHDDITSPYTTIYGRWNGTFEYRLEIPAKIEAQRIAYTIAELCGEEEECES